jgi:hypothetical protein
MRVIVDVRIKRIYGLTLRSAGAGAASETPICSEGRPAPRRGIGDRSSGWRGVAKRRVVVVCSTARGRSAVDIGIPAELENAHCGSTLATIPPPVGTASVLRRGGSAISHLMLNTRTPSRTGARVRQFAPTWSASSQKGEAPFLRVSIPRRDPNFELGFHLFAHDGASIDRKRHAKASRWNDGDRGLPSAD